MRRALGLLLLGATATPLAAQHGAMEMGAADTMQQAMTGPLRIPMAREASGTAWQPDASPMYMLQASAGGWQLMAHANVFLQYIDEGGDRGYDQLGSVNWVMGMARRPLAGGQLGLRAMLSAEPLTVGECGFPVLLQSGESCDGEALHDRQHPHDLFMEVAAEYQRPLGRKLGLQLYGGPAAEPALGPVAFPHRVSAMTSPSAPISHHWQDATHISFGAVTAGLFGRRWKVEGSVFNGREPDENRYDFDFGPLSSYSGRVWLLPTERWAFQLSGGKLTEAEVAEHGGAARDVNRYTASAEYQRPLGGEGQWASTAVWGENVEEGRGAHSLLLETNLDVDARNTLFGRAEWVQKTGHDLALPENALEETEFGVSELMGGYSRRLGTLAGWEPALGARISVSLVPSDLERYYGARNPLGFAVWARISPARMKMGMDMHPASHPVQPMPAGHEMGGMEMHGPAGDTGSHPMEPMGAAGAGGPQEP